MELIQQQKSLHLKFKFMLSDLERERGEKI